MADARIGPNAITRLAEAMQAEAGDATTAALFAAAGLVHHLSQPPADMVDERDVAALHAALRELLPPRAADRVAADAGRRTGDYLLENRIPAAAQRLLGLLPRAIATRLLVRAIARHAWTFAGSGQFHARFAGGLVLSIHRNPAARQLSTEGPACHYFAATFQRIFDAILGPGVSVVETDCEAAGDAACRFAVTWARANPPALPERTSPDRNSPPAAGPRPA